MNDTENRDLIVVGGGITGLAIAYIAAKSGKKVTVVEGSENFGGLLNTFEVGGNQLEKYYHHFFTHDAEINWLIKDLGIEDKLTYRKTKMGVYHQGKVYDFTTPKDLLSFSPLGWFDKIRFGFTGLYLGKVANWRKNENVSAYKWFEKYAGKKVTKTIWGPLLKMKFGKYAESVPLAWMIGRMKQRMSSRQNGDEKLGYLDGSLKVLLDTLLSRLKLADAELINNTKVEEIIAANGSIRGIKANGKALLANQVVITIPSIYMVDMLQAHHAQLAEKVAQVKYFGAVCVVLELTNSLTDAYWLNVADDNAPFGGIIEHTNLISSEQYQGLHLAYLSKYFAEDEPIAQMSEEEIKTLMIAWLPNINPEFKMDWIKKAHVFKTRTGATVCDLNFSEKVSNAKTPIEGLFIANMMHIYPDERSVNNSIRVAAEACRVMGINSNFVPKGASLSGQIGFDK